jgi:hypothetical protein
MCNKSLTSQSCLRSGLRSICVHLVGNAVIVRTWREHAPAGKPEDDPGYFSGAVLPELRSVPGIRECNAAAARAAQHYELLGAFTKKP